MTIVRNIKDDFVEEAKKILEDGGLIAFPTETVYGLGADARNVNACKKIYEVKGRPSDNPLIVHIGNIDQLSELARNISDKAKKLINAFWPGPLTLIFEKTDKIPLEVTGGLDTIAIRMPNDYTALKFLSGTNIPVAAPSANISGKPSPTKASHVLADFDSKIDMVIDGGDVEIGIESTIVDLSEEVPKILRPGHITKEMIEKVLDENVEYDISNSDKPKAPGMKYKHYAPKGTLILLDGNFNEIVKYINNEVIKGLDENFAIVTTDDYKEKFYDLFLGTEIFSYGDGSFDDASHRLYDILRECDNKDIKLIYSVVFEKKGKGYAIMNRLEKAAALRIVRLGE